MKSRHLEDMQAQLTAHKSTVSMLREQSSKEKQLALEALEDRHNQNLGKFNRLHVKFLSHS